MSERRLYLVRHGRAAAGWDRDVDPDLDEVGRKEAIEAAHRLESVQPSRVISSPLLRCRSTAKVLADRIGTEVVVADAVREIPSPEGVDMTARVDWLRTAIQGSWGSLGPRYASYRDAVVDFVRSVDDASVIFSHFIAINAAIGACVDDDRLVIRRLDNCSITTVAVDGDRLRLVEGGREADTLIR